MKHANVLISLCLVLVASAVVAYVYVGPEGSGGSNNLEERVSDLESRVSEQLVIVGSPDVDGWQEILFSITQMGTVNVTISEILVNGVLNSSYPAWTGDNTLSAGQTGNIRLSGTAYLDLGFAEGESYQFKFVTTRGNSFYCVVKCEGIEELWASPVISLENVRYYNDSGTLKVDITIRNSGTADAKVADVYQGTSSSNLQRVSSVTYDPTTKMVNTGSSLKMTFALNWQDGTRYYFKVVTEAGQMLPFSEVA